MMNIYKYDVLYFCIPHASLLLSLSPYNPTHKEPGHEYAYIFLMAVLGQ